jgi:hypothetical protein
MPHPDQLDIKQVGDNYKLSFDYNPDFIEWLKGRVPSRDRSYDEDTHEWTIFGDAHIAAIEGVGVQKFSFATKIFRRGNQMVWKNLKSGKEEVQEGLF